ncbi:MAG: helix-turn-helix domain-containing protein [Candidatus Korobacteraceae bacterium]
MHQAGIPFDEAVREFRRQFVTTVLQENKGNQCKAARQLQLHRNTLHNAIAELHIDVRALRKHTLKIVH